MNKNILIILSILILPICFYYYLSKAQAISVVQMPKDKPVVIKFSSHMCGECRRLEPVIKKVYPKYLDKIELVNVVVDNKDSKTKQLIQNYNVTLIPTLVFKYKNGKLSKQTEGYMDEATFERYLKEILDD